ncbi:hypothetical protein EXE42_08710 [Halorubrum sp. SP3]|uniref:hypothetical protein n=1 Tax=Halorubrum sp. SP3 TaxID=1537265 RepID=UPI0010F7B428|nr:hypothetical protein [Halorubrum sp. SP3]TKX54296.1 hypothetical protein EXE42_08710 [Halorubrum sp. SP3]
MLSCLIPPRGAQFDGGSLGSPSEVGLSSSVASSAASAVAPASESVVSPSVGVDPGRALDGAGRPVLGGLWLDAEPIALGGRSRRHHALRPAVAPTSGRFESTVDGVAAL